MIQEFAEQYRVRVRRDRCGETIVPGKSGHLYEYSDSEMGVIFLTPASKPARTQFWNRMRKACEAAGMILRQCADAEGAFSFDRNNSEHVRLAMKLAGVRPKRRVNLTPERLATLTRARLRAREPLQEGLLET